jgi:hypothetical protein
MGRYPLYTSTPEATLVAGSCEGGASSITKVAGDGFTVTRTGAGTFRVKVTWSHRSMSSFCASLWADTPGDVKNYVLVHDYDPETYDPDNGVVVSAYESGTLTDFADNEGFSLVAIVKDTDVTG